MPTQPWERLSKTAAGTETTPKFLRLPRRFALVRDQVPKMTLYSSTVAERLVGDGLELPPMAKTLWPKTTNDAPALAYWVLPVEAHVLATGSKSSAVVSLMPGTVDRTRMLFLEGSRTQLK